MKTKRRQTNAKKPPTQREIRRQFSRLMAQLRSDDLDVSLGMAARIHRVGLPAVMRMIAAQLMKDLRSRKPVVREKAHQLFLLLGDRMPGGVNEHVHESQAVELRVAELVKELTNRDRGVLLRAIEQLGELKAAAKPTLVLLERLLQHGDGDVQLAAAVAIGSISGELPPPRDALVAPEDPSCAQSGEPLRRNSLAGLGSLGQTGNPSLGK